MKGGWDGKGRMVVFSCCLYGVHAQTENLDQRLGRDELSLWTSLFEEGNGQHQPDAHQC